MSVYRHRNSPFWQFDFQRHNYRFSGSTGIAKTRPKSEAKAVEAQERRAAERLVEEIRRSGRQPLTFGAAADRWWREVGARGKETDLKATLDWLKAQIGPDRPLHLIGNDDVTRAVTERRTHQVKAGRDRRGHQLMRPIGPRAVNRTVPLLMRRIFRRAMRLWDAVVLREPKWTDHLLAEPKRPIREITLAEENAIAGLEQSYHAIRRLTVIMGLRKREALLRWPQVDFENALIRIVGKGDTPRIVPMSAEAYGILWAERGRNPLWVFTFVAQKTHRCPKTGRQYVKGRRYPITYWGLSSHRRRIWPKAGVDARYHDLRHTAGMRTLRATGNLKITQRLLGHSDIATTSRFYVDALVEDVRDAMEAVASDLESRKKSRNADHDAEEAPAPETKIAAHD
jgi:integrase